MTEHNASGGGLTGATGDLTPDDVQEAFEPGERREASDPVHQAEVTQSQATGSPVKREAADESADRDPGLGGDERTEDDRF